MRVLTGSWGPVELRVRGPLEARPFRVVATTRVSLVGSGGGAAALPEEAYAAALATTPGIGPRTLRALLAEAAPMAAWAALVEGRVAIHAPRGPSARSVVEARRLDVAAVWEAHVRAGVGVSMLGSPAYPSVLARDPEAPAVLFFLGDPSVLDARPRVAIVGTRSATRYGLGVAAQIGAELAAAGVIVVSGLALGIDGAAHEGAVAAWHADRLHGAGEGAPGPDGGTPPGSGDGAGTQRGAPPVAVVAGSPASPYPRQHAGLWQRVAQAGAVLSEAPMGTADLAWRFPLRNRIIAALSDVVVVVECHAHGGSLHTVHAAAERGIPVGAVPGSVRSPASAGTNALLADGCFVVRDASDVLVAVGLAHASATAVRPRRRRDGSAGERRSLAPPGPGAAPPGPGAAPPGDGAAPPGTGELAVLDALGWERCTLDDVLTRTGLALDVACAALETLRARGVARGEGGWWERV